MTALDPLADVPVRSLALDGSTLLELRSFANADAKIAYLADLANVGATHRTVVSYARELRTIEGCHAFVSRAIAYEDEEIEQLEAAAYTLAVRRGDCDAKAVLLAALACAIGHSSRLVPMGGAPADPEHVGILILRDPGVLIGSRYVEPARWQPHGLPAPEGWTWAETTVRAELGEIPIEAAHRIGAGRADLGG